MNKARQYKLLNIIRNLGGISRTQLLLVVLIIIVGNLVANKVHSQDERSFLVDSQEINNRFSCSFNARSELGSIDIAVGFSARPARHLLNVSVVDVLTISTAQIDTTINNASTLLQGSQNPPADVSCCVELRRNGAVGSFVSPAGMINGVVTNQSEQDAILALSPDIKIVNSIQWCGQLGTYAGCAGNGTLMVSQGAGGITYAHEIGHREGLCHTGTNCTPTCGQAGNCSDCSDPSSQDVMYYRTCPNQATISASECSVFFSDATP